MTETYLVKIETTLTLQQDDYLIITVEEGGRARYKHVPAHLAKIIQHDAVKKKPPAVLGPRMRGKDARAFEQRIVDFMAKNKGATAQMFLSAPSTKERVGQVNATIHKLVKEGRLKATGAHNGKRVYGVA